MKTRPKNVSGQVTINLRADQRKRALLDRAALMVGMSRAEFIVDASVREATTVLLDARFPMLDDKAFRQFSAALDKAPSENPRLRRLLSTKGPWVR